MAVEWRQQWARLRRQESELAPFTADAAAAASVEERRQPASHRQRDAAAVKLTAQLGRHLSTVAALRAAATAPGARQRGQCDATAAALLEAAAVQLAALADEEAEAAEEHAAAMQRVQEVLQVGGGGRSACSGGSGDQGVACKPPQAAAGGPAERGMPPEVAACDAFLQRHGPTGWCSHEHRWCTQVRATLCCAGCLPAS